MRNPVEGLVRSRRIRVVPFVRDAVALGDKELAAEVSDTSAATWGLTQAPAVQTEIHTRQFRPSRWHLRLAARSALTRLGWPNDAR